MKKQLLFFILCFWTTFSIIGQQYNQGYKITSYELPIKTKALDILQDKNGFVWIATMNGLWRYDGGSFKNYVKNESDITSITNNHISCLYEDQLGDLWVGTYGGGLLKYIRNQDCFERYTHNSNDPNSISFNEIRVIFETSDNYFFVGTDGGGLNLLDRNTKKFTHFKHNPKKENSLSHNNILAIEENTPGELLIGTWQGLNLLNYKTQKATRLFKENKLATSNFHFIKKHQKTYVTHGFNTLTELDINNRHLKEAHLNDVVIKNAVVDAKENLWLLKNEEMLIADKAFSNIKKLPLKNTFGKPTFGVNIKYNNNTIWVINTRGSFFKIEPQKRVFKHFKQLGIGNQIAQTNTHIWVVNKQQINIFNKERFLLTKTISNFNKHLSIDISSDKKYVYGVDSSYYYTYSTEGILLKKTKRKGEFKTQIIKHTSKDWLWTGEVLGVRAFDLKHNQLLDFKCNTVQKENIGYFHRSRCLLEDSNGVMWIGTNGDGLKQYNSKNKTFTHYRHKIGNITSLNNNFVNTIFEDESQNLWIGTNAGLCKLNLSTRVLQQINLPVLKDKVVKSIVQDFRKNLWIGTTNGLVKLNPENNKTRIINEQDGLLSDEIKRYSLLLKNGDLVFNTRKGFMIFDPNQVTSNQKTPAVYVSKLWVNNTLVKTTTQYTSDKIETSHLLSLNHTDTKFEIEFRAIHYTNNQRCKYMYKLDGYDDNWSTPNSNTKATYTNIPPGNYTFLVKASNEDGVWNPVAKKIEIKVKPAFWDLLWVKIVGGLIISLVLFLIFRWFFKSRKIKIKIRIRKTTSTSI